MQSSFFMDSNWAQEHLQVIRTLMERAAVYRRTLAPIMFSVGLIGCVAAAFGLTTGFAQTNRAFSTLWVGTAALGGAVSYFLARRQAFRDQEAFWSPPTRRVTQALVPGFLAGAMSGALAVIAGDELPLITWLLAVGWLVAYGCALHSAGFFMERGIKLFGLFLTTFGALLLIVFSLIPNLETSRAAHAVMGLFFGFSHLAYGGYLHLTERKQSA